jgi:hypothetical protein
LLARFLTVGIYGCGVSGHEFLLFFSCFSDKPRFKMWSYFEQNIVAHTKTTPTFTEVGEPVVLIDAMQVCAVHCGLCCAVCAVL